MVIPKHTESFVTDILHVWKNLDPGKKMSKAALLIMDGLAKEMLDRVVSEAVLFVRHGKAVTMSGADVQSAVNAVFGADLSREALLDTQFHEKVFRVGRMHRLLKSKSHVLRVSPAAAMALGKAVTFLVEEVLDVASHVMKEDKKRTLTPRHITLAIRSDEDLDHLFRGATFVGGGVLPYIPKALTSTTKYA